MGEKSSSLGMLPLMLCNDVTGALQSADQDAGEAHEGNDVRHAGAALLVQPAAKYDDDGHGGDGAGGPARDRDASPPPRSTGN